MSFTATETDSEDLQALFDSVAKDYSARTSSAKPEAEPLAAVDKPAAPRTRAKAKSKAKGRAKPAGDRQQANPEHPDEDGTASVMNRVGQLTRTLHNALRELGYDRLLEKTAASIPDARNRLAYVIKMTEQAAVRVLNATETAQPIQERLGGESERLSAQWDRLFDRELGIDEFKALVAETRAYLQDVPSQTRATNAQLLEITMAQDFQDLTGQVIKKVTSLAQDLESQLVKLLVDLVPARVREEIHNDLLNGPVVSATPGAEVVTDQNQVDDLLASLGF